MTELLTVDEIAVKASRVAMQDFTDQERVRVNAAVEGAKAMAQSGAVDEHKAATSLKQEVQQMIADKITQ